MTTTGRGYRIGPAAPGQLTALPAIERAAAALFPDEELPAALREDATPVDELEAARRAGRLWVASTADGEPVGFAIARAVDGALHLAELSVHPAHGRRGLGRALVAAVLAAARANRHDSVTLTTFRHLPWNAPFYERLGFHTLGPGEIGPELAAILADEARRGLDPAKRVAMRCRLGAAGAPGSGC